MKIKCFGHRGILGQVSRIENGFTLLGHELVDEYPDLIFANDKSSHLEAIQYKKKYPNAKLILSVQDLGNHCSDHKQIIDDLTINLMQADAVTTISETVKEQMLSVFPFLQKNGISTIYQPIKAVEPLKRERTSNLMALGRLSDPNKRIGLAIQAVAIYGGHLDLYGPDDITNFINREYKNFFTYKGIVSDKELNEAYNTHTAVLVTSLNEGINLPAIESLVCKTPLVCCSDMSTSKELIPKEFICETTPFSIADKIKYVTNGSKEINDILDEYSEKYIKQFSPESVSFNIIKCYEKIK